MTAFDNAWTLLKREDYRQAGGTLIRDSEGRVLLVRRNELLPDGTMKPGGSNHGMYELPGGNVDPGETAQEGVARETLEETGLPLVNMTALEPNVYDDKQKVYHGFTADIDPNHQGELQLSDEHDEYKWMHPHEALAINDHPDGMEMPYWLSQDAETFFRGMVGGGDMQGEPMTKAWKFLKGLPEQQVIEPESSGSHRIKTMHPAIQGIMQRAGTLRPEGNRVHNDKSMHGVYPETPREGETYDEMMERLYAARRAPPGYLQGGHGTSMRPQTDMSMGEIDFPHELDEGYATREDYSQAMMDRSMGREPTVKPTVPGYAKITPKMRPFR